MSKEKSNKDSESILSVKFCGAARTVTGSMYFLEYLLPGEKTFRFCVDAGMFQVGSNKSLYAMNSNLLFDPKLLDCVVLTHAHLDHCGRLPFLVKQGFGGKIYSTEATKKIAEVVMRDAARINTDDPEGEQFYFDAKAMTKEEIKSSTTSSRVLNKEKSDKYLNEDSESDKAEILQSYPIKENFGLYNETHVDLTMFRFETYEYHQKFTIHPNLEVEFYDAGHILGSAYVVFTEKSSAKKVVFSGDLGNKNKPIIEDPEITSNLDKVTNIFTETTYGNKNHGILAPKEKLQKICYKTLKSLGQVIIPSFSVERAQEIVYFLIELMRENKIPKVPIFLDSPMASKVLQIVLDHPELYDKAMKENLADKVHPLKHSQLKILDTLDQSKTLNSYTKPAIIIAGSGMLTGGRIMKHLQYHLEKPENILLFVGYQAKGTLGREILEGAKKVEIEGREFEVKVQLELITEFSAHADQRILTEWIGSFLNSNEAPTVFLMHGEKDSSLGLGDELKNRYKQRINTYWPHYGEEVNIW